MAARSFTAPDGTSWQAWDVVPDQNADWPAQAMRHLPEVLGSGWLCFESSSEKRRLYPIPADWDTEDDVELWSHCQRAAPARRAAARPAEPSEPVQSARP